jgi:pimeloyl-ACP methyl ester carboxylesterase
MPVFAQSSPITWEKFTFDAPQAGVVDAERRWLQVPERHAEPGGKKIRLYLVKLPATTGKPGPPIIWLAGGPGNSGSRTPASAWYPVFEALRKYGDVIAFDQRGSGSSEPSLTVPARFDLPGDKSVNSPEAISRLVAIGNTIRTTMQERGIELSAYNTRESACDVDAIRQALGVDKVVLFAHSYGTHLALAVIRQYGPHVERAVLGGVSGLDQRWREPVEGDRWLERVAARIRQDKTLTQDFVGQVKRTLERLDRDPILVQQNGAAVLIGKAEVQLLVTLLSGDIRFVRNLPVLFDNLENRTNLEGIAANVQQVIRQRPVGTAMTYAMHAASGVSRQRLNRIQSQSRGAIFGNAINWGVGDDFFIKALGVADRGDGFRAPFRSDVPVLLISATLDGRTSETDAKAVGRQFKKASYVSVDGASHDFFAFSAQRLLPIMEAFLRKETLGNVRVAAPLEFNPLPGARSAIFGYELPGLPVRGQRFTGPAERVMRDLGETPADRRPIAMMPDLHNIFTAPFSDQLVASAADRVDPRYAPGLD